MKLSPDCGASAARAGIYRRCQPHWRLTAINAFNERQCNVRQLNKYHSHVLLYRRLALGPLAAAIIILTSHA